MPTVPYTKQTWTDGVHAASGARMTVLESGIHEVSLAPAVRVYHNADQSITSGVATAVSFNSERFDQAAGAADTMHSTVSQTSRLTCRYAGVYLIGANVSWGASATGYRTTALRLNGATFIADETHTDVDSATVHSQSVTTLYALAVNDYVEVIVAQTSGGGLNVAALSNYSPEFYMVRVA